LIKTLAFFSSIPENGRRLLPSKPQETPRDEGAKAK
jgi:hypothetical protein